MVEEKQEGDLFCPPPSGKIGLSLNVFSQFFHTLLCISSNGPFPTWSFFSLRSGASLAFFAIFFFSLVIISDFTASGSVKISPFLSFTCCVAKCLNGSKTFMLYDGSLRSWCLIRISNRTFCYWLTHFFSLQDLFLWNRLSVELVNT